MRGRPFSLGKYLHHKKLILILLTLITRNLPLNVEHKELKQLFYEFGRVRYCRIMFSPDTGLCTGAVHVWKILLSIIILQVKKNNEIEG